MVHMFYVFKIIILFVYQAILKMYIEIICEIIKKKSKIKLINNMCVKCLIYFV